MFLAESRARDKGDSGALERRYERLRDDRQSRASHRPLVPARQLITVQWDEIVSPVAAC